jgi:hypothetical protein
MSGTRRAYSYEPGAAVEARAYSYEPAVSYPARRRLNPVIFSRTEAVKTAAFKSVQQYGD